MTDITDKLSIGVTILGATGTIGMNTLDVLSDHPDRYHLVALTANTSTDRMFELCVKNRPKIAVMRDPEQAAELSRRLKFAGSSIETLCGDDGLQQVARMEETQYVMAGIVGAAGLLPTLAAAEAGKRVLLANKEALVMSGKLFMQAVHDHQAELLPIDSEHNAIFQCLPTHFAEGLSSKGVRRILLTASGGPFREMDMEALHAVTPNQACAHPNWEMGRKISVDSATMMNKGLEVIEACWLFNTTVKHIDVVLHPQSIVHSMVAYTDGSVLAQLGNPDMRTPIAHALAWPERISTHVDFLDLTQKPPLEFLAPDLARYPCLRLAYEALEMNSGATCILNASNEIAVENFLQGKIRFTDIPRIIEHTLTTQVAENLDSLDAVLETDQEARQIANGYISSRLAA